MNKQDPHQKGFREIALLHASQVGTCVDALRTLRTTQLHDFLMRIMLSDNPDDTECAADVWVERAEWRDESSFDLIVTPAEQNVHRNPREAGRRPHRESGPGQRITAQAGKIAEAPVVPLAYLTALAARLAARTRPEAATPTDDYTDEQTLARIARRIAQLLAAETTGKQRS